MAEKDKKTKTKTEPKSFLDNLFGGIKDFASSDRGQRLIGGIVASTLSGDGGNFLSGATGVKKAQDSRISVKQNEFLNTLKVDKAKNEKTTADSKKIAAATGILNAQTKQKDYGLDVAKYKQKIVETFADNRDIQQPWISFLESNGVQGAPGLSRLLPGDQLGDYAAGQALENPELFEQFLQIVQ